MPLRLACAGCTAEQNETVEVFDLLARFIERRRNGVDACSRCRSKFFEHVERDYHNVWHLLLGGDDRLFDMARLVHVLFGRKVHSRT